MKRVQLKQPTQFVTLISERMMKFKVKVEGWRAVLPLEKTVLREGVGIEVLVIIFFVSLVSRAGR